MGPHRLDSEPKPVDTSRRARGAPVGRRAVLSTLALGGTSAAAGLLLTSCASSSSSASGASPAAASPTASSSSSSRSPTNGRTLVAFFSRAGENYFNGGRRNLTTGNTKVLAQMLAERLSCDLLEIQPLDPYSDEYDETVARNKREQDGDFRPDIAGASPLLGGYDTVLVGSPIWSVRPRMIMNTFLESVDWTGKSLHPFVTYAVSGLGSTETAYRQAAPEAQLGESLAIRGEEVADASERAASWLSAIGLS